MWLNIDSPRVKIHRTCTYHHFLNGCSCCASVLNDFSVSLSAFSDLHSIFLPFSLCFFLSYISNHQVAVFELWTGRVLLAEIPSPSQTGICNYHTGPGRRDNIAEDTSFNIQPYFKVIRCQSAMLTDALAPLCICRRVIVVPSGLWSIQRRCSWGTTVEADPLIHQMASGETDINQKRELEIRRVSHILTSEETF